MHRAGLDSSLEVSVLVEGREVPEQGSWYTVVGVIDDGSGLNQAVTEIRELGVDRDDLTVVLKRVDTSEPEPFPDGTRYIVIPADRRGLEVPLGFAIAFIVFGDLLRHHDAGHRDTHAHGLRLAGGHTLRRLAHEGRGQPDTYGDGGARRRRPTRGTMTFEFGKVLVFASTRERRLLRPVREAVQRGGGMYYIVDRRLEPRAVHQATLHRAGGGCQAGSSVFERTGEA